MVPTGLRDRLSFHQPDQEGRLIEHSRRDPRKAVLVVHPNES